MHHKDVSRWIVRGLYLLAIFLVASPTVDLLSSVWPVTPGNLVWRYNFLELAADYLHTPILGLSLAIMVALWTRDSLLLRLLGGVMLVGSMLLLPAMGIFMVDLAEILGVRERDAEQAILVGGMIQQIKYAGAYVILAAMAIGALRTAKLRS